MINLKPVWGIDIGDSALKAVKLKRVAKQIVLRDFQIIRYADVTGHHDAGKKEGLGPALQMLMAAGLGRDPCMVSIAPQTVFNRFISLPPVDKRRIPEIVLYEARQQIPFNLDEVIWAYQPVRREFIPGEEIEIGLFAVKRDVVASYLADLTPISAQLHGIQVAPLALYNFIRHDVLLEKPAIVMDIGAQSTDLLIIDGQRFWMRNLSIAGNSFTSALQKRLNISWADAEKLKYAMPESRHRRKLLEVLRPVMRDMVSEVQRSIGYYKSLSQDVKFEEILITGEGYKLFGLDRFLSEQLQYPVRPINELHNIIVQGSHELVSEIGAALPSLGVAIGLALQKLGSANVAMDLIPDNFTIQRELHHKRFSGLIAAGLVWAIVACFFLKEKRTLANMETIGSEGADTLQKVESIIKQYKQAQKPADETRLKMFENFGTHREYYARIVGAVSEVVPRGVEISGGFEFTEKTGMTGRGFMRGPGRGRPGIPGIDDRPELVIPGFEWDEDEFDARPGGGRTTPGRSTTAQPSKTGDKAKGKFAITDARTPDEKAVDKASLLLGFEVTCDRSKEPVYLQSELPKYLKRATVFKDNIPVVSGVVVSEVQRVAWSGMRGESSMPDEEKLGAHITIGLLTAEEAIAKRAETSAKTGQKEEKKNGPEKGSSAEKKPPGSGMMNPAKEGG